jgi:hypothetical protein
MMINPLHFRHNLIYGIIWQMDDLDAQLAHRDNFRRQRALKMTPEERLREMAKLQQRMWAILKSSPTGYAHFLRRNFKARAVRVKEDDAP